jgi:hypothetical protein
MTRIKEGLKSVFDRFFDRTKITTDELPVMAEDVTTIISKARHLQGAISRIAAGHVDAQELSNEFAHIVTFAINLPYTMKHDGTFWSYALDLVDAEPGGTFEIGAEGVYVEQLMLQRDALNRVIALKLEYRDRARDTGVVH